MKKTDKYFNTTNEDENSVKFYAVKNESQNDRILSIYKKARKPLTASQVWEIYGMIGAPLTSMRRGITQLKIAGILVKTEFLKEGLYGRGEYYYKLRRHGKKSN